MTKLTVAIFFDEEDASGRKKARVEPGRLLIDSRENPVEVEFHSFVEQPVTLTLPTGVFASEEVSFPGNLQRVRLCQAPARGCYTYRVRLEKDNQDAVGGSMPRMIVLP